MKKYLARLLLLGIIATLTGPMASPNQFTFGIKSNGLPFAEVESYLPLLEARGINLYLEVREYQIGAEDLRSLLTAARDRGIRVTLWPLLSTEQGPWANELNVTIYAELVRKMMDWLDQINVHPEWFTVNMEDSLAQMDIIGGYFYAKDYQNLAKFLIGNINPVSFAAAVATYQNLITEMHRRGYKVMITTYPFMMDDFQDGDADLQDIANVPIQGIDWDALTFTTYRTAYSEDFGMTFNPSFVYDYGVAAKKLFGDKARLSIGIIGESEHGPGYTSPADLALDVAAAKASGIHEIDMFHLEGMIEKGGPEVWLDALNTPAKKPLPDPKVTTGRSIVRLGDTTLDWRVIEKALAKFMAQQ